MGLTYSNKSLTADDKTAIELLKIDMIAEQDYKCYKCHKPFMSISEAQFAHIIPKYISYIKKWGYEVIHHKKNMHICHPWCNSKVSLNYSSHKVEAQELIDEILEDLEST